MDSWRHQFPDATEIPRWGDLSRVGVAIFDLDYDAILAAMYALSTSDEGDCYLCVPPDPGIEAAALGAGEAAALGASASVAPGAGESALSGTASARVLHTFTLDSGASRSFFRDRTTLTPLSRPVAVSLADPSMGPVLASFSTVLPCPTAPSGTLSGLYLPSFSTNLVRGADLQDQGVDQFTPASQRVTHCTCARTGRHLATFTRRPGSSLYTLSTTSPPVLVSGQVAASSQVFAAASGSGPESAPCSCRLLSHQTLLWHHRLGHPSLPRLRGMASRVLEPLVVTLAPLSLRGVPPPLSCPLLLLLLRPTSVVSSRSVLRLPLVGAVALAGARGARALVGLAGAAEVVVVAVEGVGVVVGVVAEVEVSAAAVEAVEAAAVAEGAEAAEVAEAEEVAEAVEAVAELVAALHRGVAPVVVSASSSSAVVRPSPPSSFCGGLHSTQRCFGRLTDSWRHQFPDATEIPRWGDLSRAGVAIFDLDYDAILAAMYALSTSDEGDCYLCVPPDPGIEAAALGAGEAAALGASASAAPGAGESALSGTASARVLHTFTLDSGASRSFFRDHTTLTPLSRPVAVSLADPSGGPVLASFSTVLPCPTAPSGTLSGLYLPSFSTNLVRGADLQDQGVDQFTPASQRVTHCTCARTGRHLATFTRRQGSSLYTLSTESPPVLVSGQVAASSQVFAAASGSGPESAPCSCRLLSHQTLLWHHRLGHPSLPHLRGMASRVLVSGLPRSLPPLPLGPAPTCVPCVEGRQRAAPHSSLRPSPLVPPPRSPLRPPCPPLCSSHV
ncbi:unnamed protein product [Closterium sp. NIES-54]